MVSRTESSPRLILTLYLSVIAIWSFAFVLWIPYDYKRTEPALLTKVLQLQDPELFPRDFTLKNEMASGPYNFLAKLLSIVPEAQLPMALYLIWLATLMGLFLLLLFIQKDMMGFSFPGIAALTGFGFLCLSHRFVRSGGFALGHNDLIYECLRNQSLSLVLGLSALIFCFYRRFFISGSLIGLSFNLQYNIGQHMLALAVITTLAARQASTYRLAKLFLGAILVSSPTLWSVLLTEVLGPLSASMESSARHPYVSISGYFRHPHHFVYSHWPLMDYLGFGVIFIATLGLLRTTRISRPLSRFWTAILGTSLVCLVAGYFFIEVFPVDLITKLQLSRFSVYSKFVFAIFFGGVVSSCLVKIHTFLKAKSERLRIAALLAALLAGCATSAALFCVRPHRVSGTSFEGIARYVKASTPLSALFLIPIEFEMSHFSVESKRSLFLDFKRFPFTGPGPTIYMTRVLEIFDLDWPLRNEGYLALLYNSPILNQNLSVETVRSLTARYGIDYVVRRANHPPLPLTVEYQDENFVLYRSR